MAQFLLLIVLLFRKVHVLVLDQEAGPDPETDLTPGLALVHDHDATAPSHDRVPNHGHARHNAGHILSLIQDQGHDLTQDLHVNPNHDHIHILHLDHPEMKKKHLLNLKLMRIRITIQPMVTLSLSKLLSSNLFL